MGCEKTAKFDHGQPANGCQGKTAQESVELISSSLALVALRQRAGIDVNWSVQRDSRSCRITLRSGPSTLASKRVTRLARELFVGVHRQNSREGFSSAGHYHLALFPDELKRCDTLDPRARVSYFFM